MSTNEQAPYTEEQVETVARSLDGLSRQMLRAYAKSLNAPAGGVSDAMVERVLVKYAMLKDQAVWPDAYSDDECEMERRDMRAALEAALSAPEPAAQGEVFPAACMPPEQEEMKAASMAIGSWLSAALDDPSVCDEMKRDINRWFDAAMPSAPPAQPAVRVPELASALVNVIDNECELVMSPKVWEAKEALQQALTASPAPSESEGGKGVEAIHEPDCNLNMASVERKLMGCDCRLKGAAR